MQIHINTYTHTNILKMTNSNHITLVVPQYLMKKKIVYYI